MSEYKQNPKSGDSSTYSGNNTPANKNYASIDASVSSAYGNMGPNGGMNQSYAGMGPMMPQLQGLIPGQAYLVIPINGMNNQSGGKYGGINDLVNNLVSMYSAGNSGPVANGYAKNATKSYDKAA